MLGRQRKSSRKIDPATDGKRKTESEVKIKRRDITITKDALTHQTLFTSVPWYSPCIYKYIGSLFEYAVFFQIEERRKKKKIKPIHIHTSTYTYTYTYTHLHKEPLFAQHIGRIALLR